MSVDKAIEKHLELKSKRGYLKSLSLLEQETKDWFYKKGIQNFEVEKQAKKLIEEANEVDDALSNGTELELMLEIGDVMVVAIGLCEMKDISLRDCLELALDKINKRSGTFVNGSFVKDKKNT